MNTYKALDIANKMLHKASIEDYGELISNLKLQKLLYYMQGFHLAHFGNPLFEEDIEAWQYGPVVPVVYDKYKRYGNQGIEYRDDTILLEDKEEDLFDEVFGVYGEYSAFGLMNLTHEESPWKSTAKGKGHVISHDKLKEFFKTRIK